MLKPVSVLVGALMLTSTLASAKADGNVILSTLTIMEPNKPSILVDVTGLNVQIRGDVAVAEGTVSSLTQTSIFQGKSSTASVSYKDGKKVDYQVKNGTIVLTITAAKELPKRQVKTPQKPKA